MKIRVGNVFRTQYQPWFARVIRNGRITEIEGEYRKLCAKMWAFYDLGIIGLEEVKNYIEVLADMKTSGVTE